MKTLIVGAIIALLAVTGWSYTYILDSTDSSHTGTGLPIKWAPGSIPVHVMADNSTKLSDGNTQASAIVAAMQDPQRGWNQYLGNVQFKPQVLPAGSGKDGNSINEVFFSNSPYGQSWEKNTLAITTVWSIGNQRSEADTIFNTAFTWDSYRGALHANGVLDIERVAIHELGHNLGLDHPDDAGQTVTAIMNSHVSNVDSLQADDIAGVQNLYGPPGVPANDNFANAIAITLSNGTTTVNGFNTNATVEPGEPAHASNAGANGESVWWKWTAPADGAVTVDTKGSYFDTTMGVYTGQSLATLTTIGTNDDGPEVTGSTTHNTSSTVTFTAAAGTTYYIAVNGFDNGNGTECGGITLNLAFKATATAPVITTQPASVTANAGDNVSFSVTATGSAPLSYQWSFAGNAISGATSASYSLSNVQKANAGSYSVTVTNSLGSVTSSNATLTVNAVTPPVSTTPAPASGGGGGGGGAMDVWFVTLLSVLGIGRLLRNRP